MSTTKPHSDSVLTEIEREIKNRTEQRRVDTAITSPTTGARSSASTSVVLDFSTIRRELASAQSLWNRVGEMNPRPPGLLNGAVQLVKRLIRRLLSWYTRPIVEFQGSVTRALEETAGLLEQASRYMQEQGERLGQVERQEEAVADHLKSLENQLVQLRGQEEAVANHLQSLENQLVQIRNQEETTANQIRKFQENRLYERLRVSERNVRRLVHWLEGEGQRTPAAPPEQLPATPPPQMQTQSDLDYFWFEERFRGDEALIKEHQRVYVDYFRGCRNVVDLGCGRGEFLELMRENDISACGIDMNPDMVQLCREKDLQVEQGELLAYLESLPANSLGGLFAAQVIEHLSTAQIISLLQLAKQKLTQGAPLVLETVNPQCLFVFAGALYMDPSHVRPFHSGGLLFLLESNGYRNIELKYTSPVEEKYRIPALPSELGAKEQVERFNEGITKLNDLLYGCQDYAVIGYR